MIPVIVRVPRRVSKILEKRLGLFIRASHQAGFDTRSFYSGDLGGGQRVTHEPSLLWCWTMLVVGSLGELNRRRSLLRGYLASAGAPGIRVFLIINDKHRFTLH